MKLFHNILLADLASGDFRKPWDKIRIPVMLVQRESSRPLLEIMETYRDAIAAAKLHDVALGFDGLMEMQE